MSVGPRLCERMREQLPEYAEGRLSGDARAAVERHLLGCARCTQEVADLRAVIAAVRAIPPETPPKDLTAGVLRAVARRAARPAPRPFWSRVAIPATAAVGLLAVVLGYRLLEQGYTPKSMSGALRAPVRSDEGARVATPSPTPTAPAGQEVPPAVEAPKLKGVAERQPAPARPAPSPGGSPAVGSPDRAAPARQTLTEREQRELAALGYSDGPAGAARGDSDQAVLAAPKPAPRPPTPAAAAEAKPEAAEGAHTQRRAKGAPRRGEPNQAARAGGWRVEGGRNRAGREAEPGSRIARGEKAGRVAPIGAMAELRAARPAGARALLVRQGDQLALAVRLEAGPGEMLEVKSGERQLWQGPAAKDQRVLLPLEPKDASPKAIPITLTSPAGTRTYTLFAPPISQLGQQSGTLVRRYRETPLAKVLSEMSAKGGLVLLVEGPLDRGVSGELNLETPKAAVETLASYGGYDVSTEDLLVYTLSVK